MARRVILTLRVILMQASLHHAQSILANHQHIFHISNRIEVISQAEIHEEPAIVCRHSGPFVAKRVTWGLFRISCPSLT
jgi:hypothetical protein